MNKKLTLFACFCLFSWLSYAQGTFNGLEMNMGNLYRLSNAQSRSISPENFTGEKGKGGMARPEDKDKPNQANAYNAARDLGQGWKVNPYIRIQPGETITIAEISGSGAIQHIWMTPTGNWRFTIIRIYWDDETEPSVECPIADFFCMGWNEYAPLSSLAYASIRAVPSIVTGRCPSGRNADHHGKHQRCRSHDPVLPDRLHSYRSSCRCGLFSRTVPQVNPNGVLGLYHCRWHKGKRAVCWRLPGLGVNNNGWWGEGEIKFYIDGDDKFPTICGTGTEDYFCGSYNFDRGGKYTEFCTPYSGLVQVIRPDGTYRSQQRFGLYRWHINDPVRFEKDLRITIQDLGWHQGGRYLPQKSDISSVCFWYQTHPHAGFPKLPGWRELEVI